jgi:hypothetical protein
MNKRGGAKVEIALIVLLSVAMYAALWYVGLRQGDLWAQILLAIGTITSLAAMFVKRGKARLALIVVSVLTTLAGLAHVIAGAMQ